MGDELKSLVRYDYEVVDSEETISKVIPMFEEGKKSAILVKEGEEIVGVIRDRDLMRGCVMVNPHETKVKKFMIKTGVLRYEELTIEKVARRFVEDSTPFVLVKADGKYGAIYINEFLNVVKNEFKNVKAREVMNPDVITINERDSVAKALATMRNHGIDRLVVVDDNHKVVGIVTGKDIIDRVISPKKESRLGGGSGKVERSLSIMVESVMSYPVIMADKLDSVSKIIDLMVKNNISSVVIARDRIPEGIVIKKDLLETLIKRKSPTEFQVQLITKDLSMDDFDKKALMDDLEKFMRKFRNFIGNAVLFVYIKRHKENFRSLPLVHVRIKLTSDKGTFFVTGESWGVEFALNATLKKLERAVLQEKELLLDRRMVKKFYEETIL
ncbi:MAG: histidine kinase [Archaeoglobus sp.]|nr:MAG: histidine kinase [Archaeoglobus sp.]